MDRILERRRMLGIVLAAGVMAGAAETLPPVRAVTRGPKFHWFGYYDKLQFDPTGRYVLGMEVDFEHRSPRADDVITIGMVDLEENDRWIALGASRAWGWQQGCMLQWLPGSRDTVLWNDRQGDRFVCRILNVTSRKERTIPHPIYTVSPGGRWGLSVDFRRINDMRPGYGYAGLPDPHAGEAAPVDSGIWRVDLATGRAVLIVSIADAVKIPSRQDLSKAKHYFNHLLVNPDGTRFVFLHRWRRGGRGGFITRMLSADPNGANVRVVDDNGGMSHFIWRDPGHILGWARLPGRGSAFFLFPDGPGDIRQVGAGVMTRNGHVTYLPGNEWILNDTYPDRTRREQHVYLYHVPTNRRVPLGHFHLPPAYAGEWRCDTHPRFSPDGTEVCIDSPHGGTGRQLYLIDIGKIVKKPAAKR
jgi:hypothetical protein